MPELQAASPAPIAAQPPVRAKPPLSIGTTLPTYEPDIYSPQPFDFTQTLQPTEPKLTPEPTQVPHPAWIKIKSVVRSIPLTLVAFGGMMLALTLRGGARLSTLWAQRPKLRWPARISIKRLPALLPLSLPTLSLPTLTLPTLSPAARSRVWRVALIVLLAIGALMASMRAYQAITSVPQERAETSASQQERAQGTDPAASPDSPGVDAPDPLLNAVAKPEQVPKPKPSDTMSEKSGAIVSEATIPSRGDIAKALIIILRTHLFGPTENQFQSAAENSEPIFQSQESGETAQFKEGLQADARSESVKNESPEFDALSPRSDLTDNGVNKSVDNALSDINSPPQEGGAMIPPLPFDVSDCGASETVLFHAPLGVTPISVMRLGTNPEYGDIQDLTATQFYQRLLENYERDQYEQQYLDFVFRSLGYARGFKDASPELFETVRLPQGTRAVIGFSKVHVMQYSTLDVTRARDLEAFTIRSLNGKNASFLKSCGNFIHICR